MEGAFQLTTVPSTPAASRWLHTSSLPAWPLAASESATPDLKDRSEEDADGSANHVTKGELECLHLMLQANVCGL